MHHGYYHFWGIHLFGWFIWVVILFWIFAIPYKILGQRSKKETAIDTLKRRFASGKIGNIEFQKKIIILDS